VFSFHPVKIITTGEGGIALTNDPELAERLSLLRSHGITRDVDKFVDKSKGSWHYEQIGLGYNYRMTDIQASLGVSQLQNLMTFVESRRSLASRYSELLSSLPTQKPIVAAGKCSAWHLYVVRLRLDEINRSYLEIFEFLRSKGVGVNMHYEPVHLQPYYRKLGFRPGQFPQAEAYAKEAISLPIFPSLSHSCQDRITEVLKEALE